MTQMSRVLPAEPFRSLDAYRAGGGGGGLNAARHRTPAGIIHSLDRSGLRGRGGAGFPTGRKWRTVVANRSPSVPTPVVVNAAEGEPGTFKDRRILRHNPYAVVEGALIAATAVGAAEIIIGTKASFEHEREHLAEAIDEVRQAGWLGDVSIRIVPGPSEYLFGEETALLEVIEGRPAFPRVAPPYRRGHWFRSVGTTSSPGTIVCTVSGHTVRHGVGEFPMGTRLRTVIDELGGGARTGDVVAILPGVSNPVLAADALDTPLTYEDMSAVGSGLGSAGFIVVDESDDLREIAAQVARFLSVESCGQCEPCKRDSLALHDMLAAPARLDRAAAQDLLATVARGARCALAGQTERVVGSLVAMLPDDAIEPAAAQETPGPIVLPIIDMADHAAVLDTDHLDKRPDWTAGGADSGSWPAQRLADLPVEITTSRLHESPEEAAAETTAPRAPWTAGLLDSHHRIEAALAELRAAPTSERGGAGAELHRLLAGHLDLAQRFLYPMTARLDAEGGQDIAWYPEIHEREALRLLDRIESTRGPVSPRAIDELSSDVHRYVIEIEERILPLLDSRLDEVERERLAAAIADTVDAARERS